MISTGMAFIGSGAVGLTLGSVGLASGSAMAALATIAPLSASVITSAVAGPAALLAESGLNLLPPGDLFFGLVKGIFDAISGGAIATEVGVQGAAGAVGAVVAPCPFC